MHTTSVCGNSIFVENIRIEMSVNASDCAPTLGELHKMNYTSGCEKSLLGPTHTGRTLRGSQAS